MAYVLEDKVAAQLADDKLVRVLADWCPSFTGYHLFYLNRREVSPAFELLKDVLRYRDPHRAKKRRPGAN